MPEAEWSASMLYELPAAELDDIKDAIADVDKVILEWLVSHRSARETALT
jgi:hypothetical protein